MKAYQRRTIIKWVSGATLALALVALLSYGGYRYYLLQSSYEIAEGANANMEYQIGELRDKLKASDAQGVELRALLRAGEEEKKAYGAQVQSLSSTVKTLDTLAHTDKELLEKYSSVYFLNENYIPKSLNTIDARYVSRPQKPEEFAAPVLPHLSALLQAAKSDRLSLQVLSAFRSYGDQSALKSAYKIVYGAGTANSFSADQGYSEHQLGTALDFTTASTSGALAGFEKTPEYAWLIMHAHEYGFNLSYPKGNTHFVFEPWHWRYVGLELAKRLHDENKTLYDLDQRDIDTYLVKFFE